MKNGTRPYIIIVVLSACLYLNTLPNGFVYDDLYLIAKNDWIRDIGNVFLMFNPSDRDITKRPYRPLREVSYAVDYAVWGMKPAGYHLTNIALHAANAAALYAVLSGAFSSPPVALFASLLFASHPANTEAVASLAGRKELLMLLFFLLALLYYAKKKYLFSLLFFLLSMASKETAVVLPLVLMLYDYCFVPRGSLPGKEATAKKMRLFYLPALILAETALVIFLVQERGGIISNTYPGGSFYFAMLTTARVVLKYFSLLLFPLKLSADYGFRVSTSLLEPPVLLSAGALLLAAFVAVKLSRRPSGTLFAFGWIFVTMVPVLNIVPIDNIISERYMYIFSIGYCVLLVLAAMRFAGNNAMRFGNVGLPYWQVGLVMVICLYSIRSMQRNTEWESNLSLWESAVKTGPGSARAFFNLGCAYYKSGENARAEEMFRKAIAKEPAQVGAYNNLGIIYNEEKKYGLAASCFEKAADIDPNDLASLFNLASLYGRLKEYDRAVAVYRGIIARFPSFSEGSYYELGRIYDEKGEYGKAAELYSRALELNPENSNASYLLELAVRRLGG
jgi:protein O-mannosyl-transferase